MSDPEWEFRFEPGRLRGQGVTIVPVVDHRFYGAIGALLINASIMDQILTELMRALAAALPDPKDKNWESRMFGFRLKRAQEKIPTVFSHCPDAVLKLSKLSTAMGARQKIRNAFAHGTYVTVLPKTGEARLLVQSKLGGNTVQREFSVEEVTQAYHDIMCINGELVDCFDPESKVHDPPVRDRTILRDWLRIHHPQASIYPLAQVAP